MANSKVINALAKVMIAAAWADGSISNDEMNSLKDLLFQLPDMTASDWAELEIYIDSPVGEAERTRLVVELQDALQTPADKSLAVNAIDEMVHADGALSQEEEAVAREIIAAVEDVNVGVFGRMGRLLVTSRSRAVQDAPNRELYLEDFEKNKIYFNISRRLELDNAEIDLPDRELRKLSLAGGLMARVAYVDRKIQEGEFESMVSAIQTHWKLSDIESALVAEVAVNEIGKDMDYYRLSRGFFENTNEQERVRFLDVLFAVADGDGFVSNAEIEEIRTIATVLKLTHRQFIEAKLKVPGQRRAN